MNKYLIIQLASYGDCLYATTIAKQLKHDDPSCRVTWAIGSAYASILDLNPFVDECWVINVLNGDFKNEYLRRVTEEATRRMLASEFTHIICSQIPSFNWHRYNGTIRGTILSSCPNPISVGVSPVVLLTAHEIARVRSFIRVSAISSYRHVLLFECSPTSGQSVMTPAMAVQIAEEIVLSRNDICIVLTSPEPIHSESPHLRDASCLSFRENAELANYCTGLVGCSSGITWISTSEWVEKKLPMIQLLSTHYKVFAGVEYDHHCWGLDTSHVVELLDPSFDQIVNAISSLVDYGVYACKLRYHQAWRPNISHYKNAANFLEPKSIENLAKLSFSFARNNPHVSVCNLLMVGSWIVLVNNRFVVAILNLLKSCKKLLNLHRFADKYGLLKKAKPLKRG